MIEAMGVVRERAANDRVGRLLGGSSGRVDACVDEGGVHAFYLGYCIATNA